MKKKFKKLSLNTETLRNLNEPDLKAVAGGASEVATECTLNCTACTGTCSACTRGCSGCTVACSVCCI